MLHPFPLANINLLGQLRKTTQLRPEPPMSRWSRQGIGVFSGDTVELSIVNTEAYITIFLFDKHHRGSPWASWWFYHPLLTHLSNGSLPFFSLGKRESTRWLPNWSGYLMLDNICSAQVLWTCWKDMGVSIKKVNYLLTSVWCCPAVLRS